MTERPLAGLLVLDLSRILAGPLCAMRLADLGARVIKVESPDGDPTRGFGPPFVEGESSYFMAYNRGKEVVRLDLKTPEGLAFCERVIEKADVVIENFRPGVMDRIGLSDERITAINPKIIRVKIRGYALDGARSHEAAFDLAIQAESGLMSITGPEDGEPCRVPFSASDVSAGLSAAEATIAALFQRERSGEGALVEVALMESTIALFGFQAQMELMDAGHPKALGHRHPSLAPYQVFETQDGAIVLAVATDAQWHALCRQEDMPHDLDRSEWALNGARGRDRQMIADLLTPVFRSKTTEEWSERLRAADIPAGRVRSVKDALDEIEEGDDQLIVKRDHAHLGPVKMFGNPVRLDGARPTAERAAPVIDQHGEELLREWADGDEEFLRWRAARAQA